jgi:uncharacterized lipoprotein YehR (DUF1307 family)
MQELKTYRNEKLGIEIKVPQLASNNGGPNIDKVTVIESDDSIVWITIKNDNQLEASKQQLSDSVSDYKKVSGIPWAILVKKVKNDVDLEEFIQMRYGKACKLKSKQLSTQPGILNVDIEGSGPESDCFLNFVKKVKYSPEKELVAAWDIGQAPKFFDKNEMALDELMSSSFKFIK